LHFPWFAALIERSLWRRERAIICVSRVLKKIMIEEAGIDESHMVGFKISPVAVDVDRFLPSTPPSPEVLELARGRIVAGYVGTLTAWHGVDLFFDVAEELKKRNVPVLILTVGGETDRVERLRARTAERGLESHLYFYGSISHNQVPAFMAAMQICLIADTQDWSSPTKFFEFAAMEKPIIASESPSVHEVFGSDEQSGLFFQRGDARAMADRIEQLVADPEMGVRIAKAARRRVLASYTWACNVNTIMELYKLQGITEANFQPNECADPNIQS
jgi:glycosyltransferase involved in cell wall biosynthesis